jgi:hypothetical protein
VDVIWKNKKMAAINLGHKLSKETHFVVFVETINFENTFKMYLFVLQRSIISVSVEIG